MDGCPYKRDDDNNYYTNLGVPMATHHIVYQLIIALNLRSSDILRLGTQVRALALHLSVPSKVNMSHNNK